MRERFAGSTNVHRSGSAMTKVCGIELRACRLDNGQPFVRFGAHGG